MSIYRLLDRTYQATGRRDTFEVAYQITIFASSGTMGRTKQFAVEISLPSLFVADIAASGKMPLTVACALGCIYIFCSLGHGSVF